MNTMNEEINWGPSDPQISNNEELIGIFPIAVHISKYDKDILEEFKKIVWDIPIVSVKDATGEIPASDITNYTDYLKNYKSPEGVDLGYPKDTEQLIKMEFPKKLKKDFYGKSIRLTKKIDEPKKIDEQTQRLVA